MTYFFPFGILNPTAVSSSFTATAVTASLSASGLIIASTSSYAPSVQSTGATGPTGATSTSASCAAANPTSTAPTGPSGPAGPTGPQGPSLTTCPAGSILCPDLTPPSGYTIVCMQTGGCGGGTAKCPDSI